MFSNVFRNLSRHVFKKRYKYGYETILEAYFAFAYYTGSAIYKIKKDKQGKYKIHQNSIQKVKKFPDNSYQFVSCFV